MSLWYSLYLRIQGYRIGKKVTFQNYPIIESINGSKITIGDNVVICSDSKFTALGINHKVIIRTLTSAAKIYIGNNCGISGATICAAEEIKIGENTMLGANVSIMDTDFHPIQHKNRRYNKEWTNVKCRPVNIGNNVFIGTNAIILKGVSIGDNSIIAAGAIISKNIPANVIAYPNIQVLNTNIEK